MVLEFLEKTSPLTGETASRARTKRLNVIFISIFFIKASLFNITL
jgi:hypothetical protein